MSLLTIRSITFFIVINILFLQQLFSQSKDISLSISKINCNSITLRAKDTTPEDIRYIRLRSLDTKTYISDYCIISILNGYKTFTVPVKSGRSYSFRVDIFSNPRENAKVGESNKVKQLVPSPPVLRDVSLSAREYKICNSSKTNLSISNAEGNATYKIQRYENGKFVTKNIISHSIGIISFGSFGPGKYRVQSSADCASIKNSNIVEIIGYDPLSSGDLSLKTSSYCINNLPHGNLTITGKTNNSIESIQIIPVGSSTPIKDNSYNVTGNISISVKDIPRGTYNLKVITKYCDSYQELFTISDSEVISPSFDINLKENDYKFFSNTTKEYVITSSVSSYKISKLSILNIDNQVEKSLNPNSKNIYFGETGVYQLKAKIEVESGKSCFSNLNVEINSPIIEVINTDVFRPIYFLKHSESKRLYMNNSLEGYTYYWQNSSDGKSEANSKLYLDNPSVGTYFLRAKHNDTNEWIPGSISYTIRSVQLNDQQIEMLNSSASLNYSSSYSFRKPFKSSLDWNKKNISEGVIQSRTYYDGLGRPIENVKKQSSIANNSFKDIITPIAYNDKGQSTKSYLPYVGNSSNGEYVNDAITSQGNYYISKKVSDQTSFPYNRT